ncbi:calcium-dependent protein kinase 12-like isoform X9 [Magnolia sinica]|uniref:calcium-dependent protein kinase 12-like isoform X9 n=1 Tax=Magnolia sinica TaxID=86752 RepID=UPI00265A273B|nr:calcium-dependent protein kinase 12-like isoform X9 [Magnolia sinica]
MENTETLREWFERVDSEKTSSITALQLKSAFAVGNLEFSLSVVQQMIRMYDFDRNGTMSFEEFVALNKFLMKVQNAFSALERALIKTRRAGSGWMILYHSVYLYSQLGIYLIRLIQLSRGESRWISTSLFTALPIAEYEINFSSLEDHSA